MAVKRPVSTLMVFAALIIFGLIAAADLPIEFLPEIQVPKLVVTASYPGLPPEQVKELLTIPLEDGLSSVKGIRSVFSVSREGLCTVELEFHWGTDMIMAAVETREAIDLVYPSLPSESKKPIVLPINPGEEPIMWIGVFPVAGDLTLARRLADREIKTRLQQVEGVGSIMLIGGTDEEIAVDVDLQRCIARGITLDAIAEVLAQSNYDFPAGSFTEGATEYLVKTEGRLTSEDELANLVIGRTEHGNRVTLREVAAVFRRTHEKSSLFQLNGDEGVALLVRGKGGVSPLTVARNVAGEIEPLERSYGRDVSFRIVKDTSNVIASSVHNLVVSGFLGAAIAFFILLLFIRKLTTSIILIGSIPVSILISLLLLHISGVSLNVMSLGGLAMGIGMLVDNSVVVLENLGRRIGSVHERTTKNVIAATAEMAGSTFGSTLTSLVVFLPVIFLPGIVGALFKDLALSVSYALLASFFVSVTLVPVLYLLATHLPAGKKDTASAVPAGSKPSRLERWYRSGLRFSLRHPVVLAACLAAVFILGIAGFSLLKVEFMPSVDTGEINVTAVLPPGTSIEHLSRIGAALSRQALWPGNIEYAFVRAGGEIDDPYFLADPVESAEKLHMTVQLKDDGSSAFRTLEELKTLLSVQNAEMLFSLPDDFIAPLLGIRGLERVLMVKADTQSHALSRAESLRRELNGTGAFSAVNIIPQKNKPGISLYPEREILLRNNMSLLSVANTLRGYLDGLYPSQFHTEGREIDIRVRLREQDRSNLAQLSRIELQTGSGGRVLLRDCVAIRDEKDFSRLIRKDKKDVSYLELSPRDDRQTEADRLVGNVLRERPDVESLAESAFQENLPRILLIFGLALLLLYLVLGAQFESFGLPLILMLSLPLAFSGIVLALLMAGRSINLSSSLGALVLLGIVVNNSIILFENFKGKIKQGFPVVFAIYRGSTERLKAILITALTTVTALLPIAIDPLQKSSQSSMAVAIIGGLALSTFLTLFVTPLIFLLYFRRRNA